MTVKAITVNAADADVAAITLSADKLQTLTVVGTEDVVFSSTVGAAAETSVINMAGVVGKAEFTLVGNLVKDVTITTGAGKDKVTLGDQDGTPANSGASHTITINTGDNEDTFTTGAVNASTAKTILAVNLGAGNDTMVVTDNKAIAAPGTGTSTIAFGDGTDTMTFAGSTATNISGVTITGLEKSVLTGSANLKVQAASFTGSTLDVSSFGAGLLELVGTNTGDTINAGSFVVNGSKGIAITGGTSADAITGTSGDDVITGAAGKDTIDVKAGTDTVKLTAGTTATGGDSGTFATPVSNTISTSSFDVITGMAAGDKIQFITNYAGNAGGADGLVVNGVAVATDLSAAAPADNSLAFIKGTYTSSTNTFVGSGAGTDSMLVYDSAATLTTGADNKAYEAIVLVGYVPGSVTGIGGNAGLVTLA